jgi:hypothetical protein
MYLETFCEHLRLLFGCPFASVQALGGDEGLRPELLKVRVSGTLLRTNQLSTEWAQMGDSDAPAGVLFHDAPDVAIALSQSRHRFALRMAG